MAVKIGDVTIRIGASTTELEKDLRKAERALQATAQKFNRIGQDLTIGLTAPLAAFGVAATASFADFERLSKSLEAVMGDAEAAAVEFEKLRKVAEAPGLALPQVVSASAKLQAVGLSADDARKTIAEFGNAVARSGGGAQEFDGAVLALTQIASKGKISAEEINQLGERIFEIRPALQAAFGTANSEELQKLGISAEEFIAKTTAELSKLQRVEGGLSNSFENFRDSITGSLSALGESISKAVDLPKLLDSISSSINDAVTAFRGLNPEVQKAIVIIATVAAAVGPALIVFGQLYKTIGLVGVGWVRFTKLFQAGSLVAAINPVTIAVAAIAAAVYLIYKNWEVVKKSLVDVINYWIELYNQSIAFRAVIQSIVFVFKTIYEAAKTAVNIIITVFKTAFEYIVNGFKNAGDLITAVLTGNWGKIGDIIKNSFSDAFDTVTKGISEASKLSDDFGRTLEQNFLKGVDAAINPKKIKKITADDILKTTPSTTDKTKEKDKPKGKGIAEIKIPEIETTKKGINDLIPIFKTLQSEATKVTLKKLGNDLSVSNVGLNKTAAFLRDVNSEVEAIQVRTDRGFITNTEADLEKLEVLKKALQNALQQGLGQGVVDQINQQISDLGTNVKPQFDNIFDYLGNKIAAIPSIAEKLGKDLKSLGPEISKAIEGSVAAIQQVFSTIGSYFTLQEQNLDAFEEKEKQRIENSLLGEQQKADALDKLNEDVLKKRKILARKQAAIDKAQAIFSAVIAGANAVVQAYAVPLIGPVLAKVVAGLVAAQIGFISAQPLPSLAIGTDMVKRDGLAMIHKGEAIVPANVVKGGFTGGANQLTGRLSGIDILISARNSERYLNRIG